MALLPSMHPVMHQVHTCAPPLAPQQPLRRTRATRVHQCHATLVQVISSAIANKPPPDLVVSALNTSSAPVMIDQVRSAFMLELIISGTTWWSEVFALEVDVRRC